MGLTIGIIIRKAGIISYSKLQTGIGGLIGLGKVLAGRLDWLLFFIQPTVEEGVGLDWRLEEDFTYWMGVTRKEAIGLLGLIGILVFFPKFPRRVFPDFSIGLGFPISIYQN